jgi:hypothetical protein
MLNACIKFFSITYVVAIVYKRIKRKGKLNFELAHTSRAFKPRSQQNVHSLISEIEPKSESRPGQ